MAWCGCLSQSQVTTTIDVFLVLCCLVLNEGKTIWRFHCHCPMMRCRCASRPWNDHWRVQHEADADPDHKTFAPFTWQSPLNNNWAAQRLFLPLRAWPGLAWPTSFIWALKSNNTWKDYTTRAVAAIDALCIPLCFFIMMMIFIVILLISAPHWGGAPACRCPVSSSLRSFKVCEHKSYWQ